MAFPKLTVIGDCRKPLTLEFEGCAQDNGEMEVAFLSGLGSKVVDIRNKEGGIKEATCPDAWDEVGLVYLLVVEKGWAGGDKGVKAGPAMLKLDFDSNGKPEY